MEHGEASERQLLLRGDAAVILYHGTTPENAERLLKNGWEPNIAPSGGNCGQARYLYLSTEFEDALWFSQQKGCDVVLEVRNVPFEHLKVDPEDGVYDRLEEEMNQPTGLPGKVVLWKPHPADGFAIVSRTPRP